MKPSLRFTLVLSLALLAIPYASARARPQGDDEDWEGGWSMDDKSDEEPKPVPAPAIKEEAKPVAQPAQNSLWSDDVYTDSLEDSHKQPEPVDSKTSGDKKDEPEVKAPVDSFENSFEETKVEPPAAAPAALDSFEISGGSQEKSSPPQAPASGQSSNAVNQDEFNEDLFPSEDKNPDPPAPAPEASSDFFSDENQEEQRVTQSPVPAKPSSFEENSNDNGYDYVSNEENQMTQPRNMGQLRGAPASSADSHKFEQPAATHSDHSHANLGNVPQAMPYAAPDDLDDVWDSDEGTSDNQPSGGAAASDHQGHHHLHSQGKVAEPVTASSPVLLANELASGIVHVKFNESCGDEGTDGRCDPGRFMECSSKTSTCVCQQSHPLYAKDGQKCVEPSNRLMSYSCIYDEQCHWPESLGPLSYCNLTTRRCECQKTDPPGLIFKNLEGDKCVRKKHIGYACPFDDHESCTASIPNSVCVYRPKETSEPSITVIEPNATAVCMCAPGYVYDPTLKKPEQCLKVAEKDGDSCNFDKQCTYTLGPYSRCFSNVCQCFNAVTDSGLAVYSAETNKCYPKVALAEACQDDAQCKASIHDDAVCLLHESFMPNEKVCHCPEGKTCVRDGNAATLGSTSPNMVILIANFVIMAFGATKVLDF